MPPIEVTTLLGIDPDEQNFSDIPNDKERSLSPINGWFLTTEGKIDSLDSRRHIDWIISKVFDVRETIQQMINEGFQIDIFSYWESRSGHGGPTLSSFQIQRLALLGIDVSWDIYFYGDEGIDE